MVPESQLVAEMWDYILYSMNATFGRTRVTLGWNLVEPDSTAFWFCTFSNLSGMERLDDELLRISFYKGLVAFSLSNGWPTTEARV